MGGDPAPAVDQGDQPQDGPASRDDRRAITNDEPPKYSREGRWSKLDPFKDEITRLLREDPDLPGVRVGEVPAPLGWDGGKTILDDYLREVRPLFQIVRTTQRTIYRPGEICEFDVWQPCRAVPVGHGQTRPAWVVVACLGYSRAGAGRAGVLQGAGRSARGDPPLCVAARWAAADVGLGSPAGIHGHKGRPSEEFAAFCGQLRVGWHFVADAIHRPRARSSACRASWRPTSSRAGYSPTSATSKISSTHGS